MVEEVAKAYKVHLAAKFTVYADSEQSLDAVTSGKADVTDPFYRHWTVAGLYPRQASIYRLRIVSAFLLDPCLIKLTGQHVVVCIFRRLSAPSWPRQRAPFGARFCPSHGIKLATPGRTSKI